MEIKEILSLVQEVNEFSIGFEKNLYYEEYYPILIGRNKTENEEDSGHILFDNKVYVFFFNTNEIKIQSVGDKISIREIINLFNIDSNKIDFSKVIEKFNEFEKMKTRLGNLHLEFL